MENELDERRKRTLGVIAAIFACRKLAALEGKPSPAREMAFRDSIDLAAEMMRRIDSLWKAPRRRRVPLLGEHDNHGPSSDTGNLVGFVKITRDFTETIGADKKLQN